ncbi:restriction endonuclease [Peptoniphilus equinus]|uniref:Restriction endonuclease n=1 Tax=Peptoniphilus equinus TaxID=3016343 RepID=A0ABY7QV24_9FIRM|nr:restriction endonuclease [Peptoniphilus equinus]WBW49885.1 restriction endonuclease [Peptoniphilus equinus]
MYTKAFTYKNLPVQSYTIAHDTIPMPLSPELTEALEYLLWYVPNIASIQSQDNPFVSNRYYDDYTFTEIMHHLNLDDEDVLITKTIDPDIEAFFKKSIIPDRQKVVLTVGDDETKTEALFRHIRNAIAHGYITVAADLLVGFDYKYTHGNNTECTAIFQIHPRELLAALRRVTTDLNNEDVIVKAFTTCGYYVDHYEENFKRSTKFDLFVKKDSQSYGVELRNSASKDELDREEVTEMIRQLESIYEGLRPVLVINSSFLKEASKEELLSHEVIILDIKNIKKMLQGRDMLGEITSAQREH